MPAISTSSLAGSYGCVAIVVKSGRRTSASVGGMLLGGDGRSFGMAFETSNCCGGDAIPIGVGGALEEHHTALYAYAPIPESPKSLPSRKWERPWERLAPEEVVVELRSSS